MASEVLNVGIGRLVGVAGDEGDEVEQGAFGIAQGRGVEVGASQAFMQLRVGVLRPQEEGVAADSVGAPVQGRNIGGDHLLDPAGQVPILEVDLARDLVHPPE